MEIHVRFFASVREKLHLSETARLLPAGTTVRQLLDDLCRDFPALGDVRASLSTAVNREYVGPDHVLSDQDEVAIIPPVSGGVDA